MAEAQQELVEGAHRCRVGRLERPFTDLQSTRKWYFEQLEECRPFTAEVPDCILLNRHNQIIARITADGKFRLCRDRDTASSQAPDISPEKWQLAMIKWLGG